MCFVNGAEDTSKRVCGLLDMADAFGMPTQTPNCPCVVRKFLLIAHSRLWPVCPPVASMESLMLLVFPAVLMYAGSVLSTALVAPAPRADALLATAAIPLFPLASTVPELMR